MSIFSIILTEILMGPGPAAVSFKGKRHEYVLSMKYKRLPWQTHLQEGEVVHEFALPVFPAPSGNPGVLGEDTENHTDNSDRSRDRIFFVYFSKLGLEFYNFEEKKHICKKILNYQS